ncbi:MAG: hypothetical protein HZA46_14835 [Planctomycetales bacterium]|nr:hypothetical protein [Planctomycetales bacterium]
MTRRIALIACSLLVPVAIYFLFFAAPLPKMSLESLHGQLVPLIGTSADHSVPFVDFEAGQSALLPQNNLRANGLRGPYLATLQSRGQRRRAAAYFLEITGKSRPIPVALVVVPLEALEISSVPSETSFLQSTAIPLATGVFVSVWREGDLVYLCYVRGTEGDLRLLWQRSGSA